MKSREVSIVLSLLLLVSSASAVTIDVGPTYTPPGMGTEMLAGDPDTAGGTTISYLGVDPNQTANLYFGIRNDLFANGASMDGAGISGAEIFRFDFTEGVDQIFYAGTTTLEIFPGPVVYSTPTRMTLSFSGSGTLVVDDTTHDLSNENGDVGALWKVLGNFTVNILMEAQVPPGEQNEGNWEPVRDLFDRLETGDVSQFLSALSVDWAFYYEALSLPGDANGDGVVDGADYTIWADNFGITDATGPSEGDFNDDGIVDGADYTIWADNFGSGAEPDGGAGSGQTESAGEPPACGLGLELLVVVPLLLSLRSQRRLRQLA